MSKEYHEVYKITDVKDEVRDVKTFRFDKHIIALPGQFVMLWLPGVSENPFSVSYINNFGVTVKKMGDKNSFTSKLFDLNIGDRVWSRGPYGNPFPTFLLDKELDGTFLLDKELDGTRYLVCGGTGSIPLAFFSEVCKIMGRNLPTVFLGAKTKDDIIFEERFRESSKEIFISTEDGSRGHKGLVTDLFEETEILPNSLFYICGPERMLTIAAEKAMRYTNAENIFLSLERYMKCGRGICGSCEINGYRTCIDGPVFTYDELLGSDFGRYTRTKSGRRIEI